MVGGCLLSVYRGDSPYLLSSCPAKLTHARILLKADATPSGPDWSDGRIAEALDIGRATVERVRKQFVEEGLKAALERRPSRRQYRRKLDGDGEADGRPEA